MAELKVDKILPATGSSISLSESGKTVLIPSGATLDASAATLSGIGARVDYCTSVQSSPFTAAAGKGYFINTGSAVTVTLPSSPSAGDEIIVIDSTGQAATNNITLGRNTNKIKGLCACATLKTDRVGVRIIYSGSSQGWVTVTSANETPPVLDQTLYVTATGGTVTTCGDFKIHTFTSDATFSVSCAGTSSGSNKVDYLVVAGGAAGGQDVGGGGGAGGLRIGAVTVPGCAPPAVAPGGLPVTVTSYPITVGGGGASASTPGATGANGSNSIFSTITSTGGGGGGSYQPSPGMTGASGGSGGGGSGVAPSTGGAGNTPPTTPSQGNSGGGTTPGGAGAQGGGGGGASAAGVNGINCQGGAGGSGTNVTSIFGASPKPYYAADVPTAGPTSTGIFAGGGGGGPRGPGFAPGHVAQGGNGGGGDGRENGTETSYAGVTNSGGGGGAGPGGASPQVGASGGSGVVIIRYKFQN
tara:strand:+ start:1144 stop:2556 length:1413 start_codon:yes stop_codon:yes gene_type:complete